MARPLRTLTVAAISTRLLRNLFCYQQNLVQPLRTKIQAEGFEVLFIATF